VLCALEGRLLSLTLAVMQSGRQRRKSCMGPECHLCCCFRYASYDSGSSPRCLQEDHKALAERNFRWMLSLCWRLRMTSLEEDEVPNP